MSDYNLPTIQILDWDSKTFGYIVAKLNLLNYENAINIVDIKSQAKNLNIKLLYIFTNPQNKSQDTILKNSEARFVDNKVEYTLDINEAKQKDLSSSNFTELTITNLNDYLYDIALEAGKHSRYNIDDNFKNGEFESLYRVWLEKSLSKEIAFISIGILKNEKVEGLVTLGKKDEQTANIGLIAINQNYQNKGLGSQLIGKCIEICKERNFENLTVTTQGLNKSACTFYEKNGFKKTAESNIFHLWL